MRNQAMHVRPAALFAAATVVAASGCATQQPPVPAAKVPALPEAPVARATPASTTPS